MKTITRTVFVTPDGLSFDDETKAKEHEAKLLRECPEALLEGRTHAEIREAIDGHTGTLADALEAVGSLIARARRERGDLKRRPRPRGKTAAEAATEPVGG